MFNNPNGQEDRSGRSLQRSKAVKYTWNVLEQWRGEWCSEAWESRPWNSLSGCILRAEPSHCKWSVTVGATGFRPESEPGLESSDPKYTLGTTQWPASEKPFYSPGHPVTDQRCMGLWSSQISGKQNKAKSKILGISKCWHLQTPRERTELWTLIYRKWRHVICLTIA